MSSGSAAKGVLSSSLGKATDGVLDHALVGDLVAASALRSKYLHRIRTYLEETLDSSNYPLFHGLHKLSRDRYLAIMTLLMDGAAFPDELPLLGAFTDAEADAFIQRVGTRWDGRFMGVPSVAGTSGYDYYLNTLGMRDLLEACRVVERRDRLPVHPYVTSGFRTGAGGHYPNVAALVTRFSDVAVAAGLAQAGVSTLQEIFPTDDAGIRAMPIPNRDTAREDLFLAWVKEPFAPLLESGGTAEGVLRALYSVDRTPSEVARAPSFATFLLSGSRPYADTQLRLHRTIAANSAGVPLFEAGVQAVLTVAAQAPVSEWGCGAAFSRVDLSLMLAGGWLRDTEVPELDLPAWFTAPRDALQAVFNYRTRLRLFIWGANAECRKKLAGDYPGGDAPVLGPPFTTEEFALTSTLGFVRDEDGKLQLT